MNVKHIFIALLSVLLFSCSSDSDFEGPRLELSQTEATLKGGKSVYIKIDNVPFKDCTITMDDDFHAYLTIKERTEEIQVTAFKVGTTYVRVRYGNQNAACKITVVPFYAEIPDDLCLDFGSSASSVKKKIGRSTTNVSDKEFYYDDGKREVHFIFDQNNKLEVVCMYVYYSSYSSVLDSAYERYNRVSEGDPTYGMWLRVPGEYNVSLKAFPEYRNSTRLIYAQNKSSIYKYF